MREDWEEIIYKDAVYKISTSKQKLKQKQYLKIGTIPIVDQGQDLIGGYTNDEKRVIECDLPVLVFGDHTKITKLIDFKFAPGADGTKILEPSKFVLPEYLSIFTKVLAYKIKDNGYARHFQHVEKELLPLAPLPIQRAIISKTEELFSDLDNGIANFKKAQEQLKIYRQAVLKKAFEGKLSELGKVGLKDDRIIDVEKDEKTEILKSNNPKNPNSDNEEDNLPKGWKWVKSGELFSFVTSGSRGWAKYYSESGSIFIRITNLNFDTLNLDLREEKIQYVNPPQNSEGLRTRVQEGDFLFSITGYLGMFAIAPKLENAFVNQHVSLCRPKDFFDKKYLAYWIISKSGGHYYLNKNQKGAVKAGLNLDDLKNFPVPLPSTFAEQTQIVQEIERRLSVCDKMEQSINESLEKAEALRQSILKKAFDGKLLSQAEIEQCKRAADYEPASELLKKIKAEKLAKEQEKKKVTTKKKSEK